MTTPCPFGFRVLGPATAERQLVDANAAFAAYASCDDRAQVKREAYFSAFQFGPDFSKYLKDLGTVKGFDGTCWARWIWFDVDRQNLEIALTDSRKLVRCIMERYPAEGAAPLVFFSGSKGFHVGIPTALWAPEPSVTFHKAAKQFASNIAAEAGVVIDPAIYDKVRLFRAPNSRHAKTGWHKRLLKPDELLLLPFDDIVHLAESPAPFTVADSIGHSDQAAADWASALATAQQQVEAINRRRAECTPTLNRTTLDFIVKGAETGDRHRMLFSAAANLAEFACPSALAHALLTDQGLDCGLSPSEVKRQIDCGLGNVPLHAMRAATQVAAPVEERPKRAADLDAQLAALWDRQPMAVASPYAAGPSVRRI
jgi:hypothetical protein